MTQFAIFVASFLLCARMVAAQEPHPNVLAAEQARVEAVEKATAATVAIFAPGGKGGGSGVIISPDGFALSNFHVTQVGPALECGLPDGHVYDAVIVGIDPTGDVALIKLFGRDDFPYAEMGDSDSIRAGEWVFAAGNPFLLAEDFRPSISYGIVSAVNRYQYPAGTLLEYADCIQTDAAINPGSSGGPLFNARGQLVGINGRGSFEKRGRVNVGVGYAISINQIKRFDGYLRSGRIVDHATLGATVQLDEEGRVVIEEILESSDAYRRGLRFDDELVRFAGREIGSVNAFKNILGTFPKGWRVPLVYRRDGQTYECVVRLTGAHRDGELIELLKKKPPKPVEGPEPKKGQRPGKIPAPPQLPAEVHAPTKVPDVVANHFEKRRGFANYFYAKQNRDRIWNALTALGDFSIDDYRFTMDGADLRGGKVHLSLSERSAALEMATGKFQARIGVGDELPDKLGPTGSGGMFAALHLWQRLLIEGPETYGDVIYLGTMPIPTQTEWVDVLVGTYGGAETLFYFDRTVGDLVGLEFFADPDRDPCEIRFGGFRETNGRRLPHRWEVRHGDRLFGIFEIDSYQFGEKASVSEDRNSE